ncbi:MAG: TerB family tellurite resistance protein [Brevundimonas sp.]|uniref:tellurite resistance TerB family protein n=1 Tax=Brevundimonas sp. TaxID=1871086 RepID=UPI002ABCD897|nr:TerB family tellurite resistance protein [Brevundimonas sp.]MDZ4110161.1 TerB family tellurite resistance protein [Brevundimonas sp.]
MDAVAAACALVAQADGWVTPQERKRMTDRMRESASIRFFGLHEVIVGFEALNVRFDRDLADGEAAAEGAIAQLRGQPGPSRLLIETACSVAEADGGFGAEERAALLRMCDLLDVDPARFDMVLERTAQDRRR